MNTIVLRSGIDIEPVLFGIAITILTYGGFGYVFAKQGVTALITALFKRSFNDVPKCSGSVCKPTVKNG